MAKKKKAVRRIRSKTGAGKRVAKRRKTAVKKAGTKRRGGAKKAFRAGKHKQAAKRSTQPRSWRRVCRLTEDALIALEAGDAKEIRAYLEAIRAVAVCADEA